MIIFIFSKSQHLDNVSDNTLEASLENNAKFFIQF